MTSEDHHGYFYSKDDHDWHPCSPCEDGQIPQDGCSEQGFPREESCFPAYHHPPELRKHQGVTLAPEPIGPPHTPSNKKVFIAEALIPTALFLIAVVIVAGILIIWYYKKKRAARENERMASDVEENPETPLAGEDEDIHVRDDPVEEEGERGFTVSGIPQTGTAPLVTVQRQITAQGSGENEVFHGQNAILVTEV